MGFCGTRSLLPAPCAECTTATVSASGRPPPPPHPLLQAYHSYQLYTSIRPIHRRRLCIYCLASHHFIDTLLMWECQRWPLCTSTQGRCHRYRWHHRPFWTMPGTQPTHHHPLRPSSSPPSPSSMAAAHHLSAGHFSETFFAFLAFMAFALFCIIISNRDRCHSLLFSSSCTSSRKPWLQRRRSTMGHTSMDALHEPHRAVCTSRPHIAVTCNCTLSGTIPCGFHLHSTDWSIRDKFLTSTNKVEGDFPPLSVQSHSRRTTVCVPGLAARTLL